MKRYNIKHIANASLGVVAGLLLAHNTVAAELEVPDGYKHLNTIYFNSQSTINAMIDSDIKIRNESVNLVPSSLEHLRSAYFNKDQGQQANLPEAISFNAPNQGILPASLEHLRSTYFNKDANRNVVHDVAKM